MISMTVYFAGQAATGAFLNGAYALKAGDKAMAYFSFAAFILFTFVAVVESAHT